MMFIFMFKKFALELINSNLQNNSSLTEKITKLVPNIIYIYDLEKKCNIYSNLLSEQIFGYSASEIKSMNKRLYSKIFHPEDLTAIAQHYQDCLQLNQNDYLTVEYRVQDKQGNWHWLESKDTVFERDASGKPIQILGVAQDITEIKENQLKASKKNLKLKEKVKALEIWRDRHLQLTKMNEFLQACLTTTEAKTALSSLLQPLFPNTHGAVYLLQNSKNLLEAIASWGIIDDEFWTLPEKEQHLADSITPNIDSRIDCHYVCSLIDRSITHQPTLCIPMIARSQALGMLLLYFDSPEPIGELTQKLSETVAQNIAMSFASLELQERLRYESLRDPLTRLYNRRYLQDSLEKELNRAQRKQQFVGIIMIDIDHFKNFNDLYGHIVGDLVLKEVSNFLLSQIRQYDTACRYGGEELVIVMPDASIENTIVRAEEIRAGIKQLKLEHDRQQLKSITVSIGVSCFPDDGIKSEQLIQAADRALYQAKKQGRDRVVRY
jgi:diguanylate cyclase (GGDEF)-like protein/PAS domain S-box-containing protein